MNPNGSVELLCQAALNSLKSYGRKEFTKRFLKKRGLPIDQDLKDMWISIERWLENDASKCRDLWEYVDDLRLWGRQRIFLYEVDGSYATELLDPQFVKGLVGGVYEQPLFKWEAEEPFLSLVKHTNAANTESQLLIFKLIENRKYIQVIDGKNETFEEQSTNFFILNLRNQHAELRIQELPTGAVKDVRDERDRLVTLMGNYLDFDRLVPVDLVPVMDVMMRVPVYTVWRGIKILCSLPTPEVWKAFNEARKRSRKNRQIVS